VRELGIPCGVVVNRVGSGDGRVNSFCAERGIPLLAEIRDDRRIAEAYSRGEIIVDALPGYGDLFRDLAEKVSRAVAPAPSSGEVPPRPPRREGRHRSRVRNRGARWPGGADRG
jgi:hypothetical protein